MISREEIERVADLMRIELSDHEEYIDMVQKMLAYFEILDRAGADDEEVNIPDVPVDRLRADEHIEYPDTLIQRIKNYRGTYVRAPKMM